MQAENKEPQNLFPFLFARFTPESRKELMNGGSPIIKDYIVKIAQHDFVVYHSGWMDDSELGDYCFVPDVDIAHEVHVFPTLEEARTFMAVWFAKQVIPKLIDSNVSMLTVTNTEGKHG